MQTNLQDERYKVCKLKSISQELSKRIVLKYRGKRFGKHCGLKAYSRAQVYRTKKMKDDCIATLSFLGLQGLQASLFKTGIGVQNVLDKEAQYVCLVDENTLGQMTPFRDQQVNLLLHI